jgi:hypothetical protein
VDRLEEEDISISRSALYELLKKYNRYHTIADLKRAPRPRILQEEHYRFIDNTMAENMDLTARQLYCLFKQNFSTIEVSISTIKRARLELGWICKRVKYCQLITEVNKEKRVTWCLERVTTNDLEMDDVIFTDESTVQIEAHRKVIFRKAGHPIKLVAKPKHPQKVHVWAGISARGATSIVMFTWIMNATRYTDILDASLVPFLEEHFPQDHRFQQDNDPKHTSRWAQDYFESKEINWWRTPPSSPDLNPIENVWGSMKVDVKVQTTQLLSKGQVNTQRSGNSCTIIQVRKTQLDAYKKRPSLPGFTYFRRIFCFLTSSWL